MTGLDTYRGEIRDMNISLRVGNSRKYYETDQCEQEREADEDEADVCPVG